MKEDQQDSGRTPSPWVPGEGVILDRLTEALDIIGHELAHGVTEKEAGSSLRVEGPDCYKPHSSH